MDTSEAVETVARSGLDQAAANLREAADARKCWACGCLRQALDTIERAQLAPRQCAAFDTAFTDARARLGPQQYDCLGCDVCFPAIVLNDLVASGLLDPAEAASCPTDAVEERQGWPPLPGAYRVLRHGAPVAVCTLNDDALTEAVARTRSPEVSIVGTLHTENLGIERLVSNVIANPNIRFVIACGHDSRRLVGHLPGQSLVALAHDGVDDRQRIVGAKGKRPVLRNIDRNAVDHFRRYVEVVDLIGVSDVEAVLAAALSCGCRDPGAAEPFAGNRAIEPVKGEVPAQMIPDPNGYFVIFPDKVRSLLSLEHYANNGVLSGIIEGRTAVEVYMTAIGRDLISRLDHAAYLGRELARAEHALAFGERYVQDAAPEAQPSLRMPRRVRSCTPCVVVGGFHGSCASRIELIVRRAATAHPESSRASLLHLSKLTRFRLKISCVRGRDARSRAPIPHRSGRAELSGSSTIACFRLRLERPSEAHCLRLSARSLRPTRDRVARCTIIETEWAGHDRLV